MHWKLSALALGSALLCGCAATPFEVRTESLGAAGSSVGVDLECPFNIGEVRDARTAKGFSNGPQGVVLFDDLPQQLDLRLAGVQARAAGSRSAQSMPTVDVEIRSAYTESVGSRVFTNIVVGLHSETGPARFVRGRHTASSFFGGKCELQQCVVLAMDDLVEKLGVLLVDEFDCRPVI